MRPSRCIVGELIALGLMLGGCGVAAFRPHLVDLAPDLPPTPTAIGRGAPVYLTVVDRRETKILAQRGMTPLVASEDLAIVLHRSVGHILNGLDFELVRTPASATAQLTVYVRSAEYPMVPEHDPGLRRGGVVLEAAVERDGVRRHERTYAPSSAGAFFGELATTTEAAKGIHRCLSEMVEELAADLELLAALAPEVGPDRASREPWLAPLRSPRLDVAEIESSVEIPAGIRQGFAAQLSHLLPAAGALAVDLKIEYRFVGYQPVSELVRRLTYFGGAGSIVVEARYLDGDGRELDSMRAEGRTLPSSIMRTPIECVGGCPFDLATWYAAAAIARYTHQRFVAPVSRAAVPPDCADGDHRCQSQIVR